MLACAHRILDCQLLVLAPVNRDSGRFGGLSPGALLPFGLLRQLSNHFGQGRGRGQLAFAAVGRQHGAKGVGCGKCNLGQAAVRGRRFQASASSKSWAALLSSRKPQAAASPLRVCTMRRMPRTSSASRPDAFQFQRLFIERLQQFLRGLEKEFQHFGGALIGKLGHPLTSTFW
jgi:hypothetical protein